MRVRRMLFLFACAELAACRPRTRAPAPVAVAASPQPTAVTPADDAWIARATTVQLADARTLVFGGGTARAAIWDGGTLFELDPMPEPRDRATATLLPDGRVLIAGGASDRMDDYEGKVVYDSTLLWSADGGFVAGPPMSTPRLDHTATMLLDGRVLIAGGTNVDNPMYAIATAEIFDPTTDSWRPTGSLAAGRSEHTASLLPDGRVVVIGGLDWDIGTVAAIEAWDPVHDRFDTVATLAVSRFGHTVDVVSATQVVVHRGANLVPFDEGPPEHTDLEDLEIVTIPPRRPLP